MSLKFRVGDLVVAKKDKMWAGTRGVVLNVDDRMYEGMPIRVHLDDTASGFINPPIGDWCYNEGDLESLTTSNESVRTLLPADAKERKQIPVAGGVMDYFPQALIEVAKVSFAGNEQHNPGQPLHWARGKSMDQADTMIRHFLERGTIDTDGVRHSAKMAWRALAILQLEMESEGAPVARGAK